MFAVENLQKPWYTGGRHIKPAHEVLNASKGGKGAELVKSINSIEVPKKVLYILDRLNNAGFEAFTVGGCVRDALLGRMPQDWDITTLATPEEVKKIFRRTVDTGIQHGTVTVMVDKEGFEVTTYRIDGNYNDGRHPDSVSFTRSLREDLARRDFTINAMAYHPDLGLVDEFSGITDLREGRIRCVGNPNERFKEDALRMLRAVRFAAQLDFDIEDDTKAAIRRLCTNLENISAERIHAELDKLITSDNPERLREACELGITGIVLPEFDRMMETPQNNPHHCYNVGEHCLKSLKCLQADIKGGEKSDITDTDRKKEGKSDSKIKIEPKTYSRLCWTMLLHDVGKPDTRFTDEKGVDHFHGHNEVGTEIATDILKRLKFDNESIRFISNMVYYHDYRYKFAPKMKSVRKAASKIGKDMPYSFFVQRADIMAQSEWKREEKLAALSQLEEIYGRIVEQGDCLSIRELKVRGNDLKEIGIPTGPVMGEILNGLLEFVIDNEKNNDREILLKKAKELLSNFKE